MSQHVRIGLLLGCALIAGCPGDEGEPDDELRLRWEPVGLDSALALVDRDDPDTLAVIELEGEGLEARPRLHRVELAPGLVQVVRRAGHDEVLTLSRGELDEDDERVAGALLRVAADGDDVRYALPRNAPFDRLVQADEGDHAFLFYAPGVRPEGAVNLNQAALVDLDGDDAPRLLSLRDRASGAAFSPELQVGGQALRLLVSWGLDHVGLRDLDAPEEAGVTVRLSTASQVGSREPERVLFLPELAQVLTWEQRGSDLFVIQLSARDDGVRRFRAAISQLPLPGPLTDLELLETELGPRVLASAGGSLVLLDTRDSTREELPLPLPLPGLQLLPGSAGAPQRVLLHDAGSGAVGLVELERADPRLPRAPELVALPGQEQTQLVLDDGRVLFVLGGGSLAVLDPDGGALTALQVPSQQTGNGPAAIGARDGSAGQYGWLDTERDRLWLSLGSKDRLTLLGLGRLQPEEVRLDADAASLVALPSAGVLAVVHGGLGGHLTLLDLEEPGEGRAYRGLLLERALDPR